MTRTCLDCQAPISRHSKGRCRTCAAARVNSDAEIVARRTESIRKTCGTGLFVNRTRSHRGPGRQVIAERRLATKRKMDDFADRLANGYTPELAARALGYSDAYGRVMLGKIRAGLGWQAR